MDMAEGLFGFLEDRTTILDHQMLWQVRHGDALRHGNLPTCGLTATAEDLQQCTFPSTVLAHQSNAVLRVNYERNIGEKWCPTDLYG